MKGLVGLPLPLTRRFPGGRAVLDRQRVILDDIHLVAHQESPDSLELLKLNTIHRVAEIPLLSEGKPLGSLAVLRAEVRPFTDAEVSLLETFADQAVIAIENVRLFRELEARNSALSEALEQQTATSEILRVISHSLTVVQPVHDAGEERAARLCGAVEAIIQRVDGDMIYRAAHFGAITSVSDVRPVTWATPSGRAIMERRTIHVDDILEEFAHGNYLEARALQQGSGFRTVLIVPLMREDAVIGIITIRRLEVRPFTAKQMALVKTFADQAVIAIENVRLLTELQPSNRELTTALDTQTATSDILRVISRSLTDVQPSFDAIVAAAVRLLGAYSGMLTRVAGNQIEIAALTSTDDAGDAALRTFFPQSLRSEWPHAQAIRNRTPFNIADTETDPRLPEATQAYARARGWRSGAIVPMLRHADAIGTLGLSRGEPGGFSDDE